MGDLRHKTDTRIKAYPEFWRIKTNEVILCLTTFVLCLKPQISSIWSIEFLPQEILGMDELYSKF